MAMTVTAVPHSSGTPWMRRYSVAFFANQESKTESTARRSCSRTSCGNGLAGPRRDRLLVGLDELAQLPGRDVGVGRDAEAGLHGVEVLVEDLALHVRARRSQNIVMNRR